MRVDWCVSSWFRIKNTHSLTQYFRLFTHTKRVSPGRAAKRKKMKIGGTYLLQGPFGPNKTNLPTYLGGASQWQQTPYPGRSRNPGPIVKLHQLTR